jgi:lipopolysaccharide export system protein LptA
MSRSASLLLFATLLACANAASARTSDRSQVMDTEADQNTCTLGDAGQCTMTGNVQISQGSLDIRSAKAVIYRAGGDISRAVLTGSPVVLKQQMDDGTPMTAHAGNVDYNLQTETVVFTGDVQLDQPRGSMTGQRVVYNLKTGAIDSGGQSGGGRVHMRIQPKAGTAAPASQAPASPPPASPASTTPATNPAPPKTTP